MKQIVLAILMMAVLIGCVGVPKTQVETALQLNQNQATTYADLATFTRKVLQAGLAAAPADKKQFWTDSLAALDENADAFVRSNSDLIRLVTSMESLDAATRQQYLDDLTKLIIAVKTGEAPAPSE